MSKVTSTHNPKFSDAGSSLSPSGGESIDMNSQKITELGAPTASTDATTKGYVDLAIANLRWGYYFNDTASGIDSYYEMTVHPSGEAESTFTSDSLGSGDDQVLSEWIGEDAVLFDTIEVGVIELHIHAEVTAGNRSVALYAKVYEYKADTSEVLIATTEVSSAVTTKASFNTHAIISSEYDVASTSKILVKYYANVGSSGNNVTIVLYAEDAYSSGITQPVSTEALDDVYVKGPSSSTDHMIARHDSTGGKTLQDYTSNPPTVSDTGDMNIDGDLDVENIVISGTIDGIDLSALKLDDLQTPDNNTDLNASAARHGLLLQLENTGTKYLRDDGTWQSPAGGGDVTGPGSSVDNAIARFHETSGKVIQDYTSNAPTVSDTGEMTLRRDLNMSTKDIVNLRTFVFDELDPNPSGTVNHGTIFTKADNLLYFISGDEVVKTVITSGNFTQNGGILVGTGSGTFTQETGFTLRTSIGLGNVENTVHSTDAHTMTIDGVDVSALDAAVVKESDGISISNDGTKTTIAGTAGDYNRIGDAGITDHSLNSEDDLLITGELEVDGDFMVDGPTTTFGVNTKVHIRGEITLDENVPITLDDTLSADGKYCVTMALNGTAGEIADFGEAVYFKAADSKWWLGKGDAEVTLKPMTGLVIVAGAAEAAIKIALIGEVRADSLYSGGLTIGAPVFISAATAGAVTTTELTTGQFQKAIGWAKTANVVVLTGNPDWVKVG